MRKIVETREVPLTILSRILAQSCVTPLPEYNNYVRSMIVLVSLIVLLRELGFHYFSHGASLLHHAFIFAHIFASHIRESLCRDGVDTPIAKVKWRRTFSCFLGR